MNPNHLFFSLFGLLPILIPIVILGALWHWAAEMLRELRAINKHLANIANREL